MPSLLYSVPPLNVPIDNNNPLAHMVDSGAAYGLPIPTRRTVHVSMFLMSRYHKSSQSVFEMQFNLVWFKLS